LKIFIAGFGAVRQNFCRSVTEVALSVKPQWISRDEVFFNVNGTSFASTLYTDLAGELSIIQKDPRILQTTYGVYSDLITL